MTEDRSPSIAAKDAGVSPFWLAAVMLRERRLLAVITGVGMLLCLAVALARAKYYTTTFSFLPQASQDPARAGLAGLAGQFGISLAGRSNAAESPQFYADLLGTRVLLAPIVADSFAVGPDSSVRVALPEFLRVRAADSALLLENTLRKMRRRVLRSSVATRTTGMVTVQVKTRSRHVSLAIAQRLIEGLSHFNLVTRQSQAREERRFTEGRLADARVALRAAEDRLQSFLQTNRDFESPALVFQRDRLQRAVMLQQQLVTALSEQYEENRIREVRDTPVLTVIEPPHLAARADPRRRAMIMVLGTLASFVLALAVVLVRETWLGNGRSGADPAQLQLANEWKKLRRVASS